MRGKFLKNARRSYALMTNDKRLPVTLRSSGLDMMHWRAAHRFAAKHEEGGNYRATGIMTHDDVLKYAIWRRAGVMQLTGKKLKPCS